jgi:hypothetical protein
MAPAAHVPGDREVLERVERDAGSPLATSRAKSGKPWRGLTSRLYSSASL